jgi:hypothetical protein
MSWLMKDSEFWIFDDDFTEAGMHIWSYNSAVGSTEFSTISKESRDI